MIYQKEHSNLLNHESLIGSTKMKLISMFSSNVLVIEY